ncbi:hypothetical protein [Serratia silvae]|uniref:hypothetical protein n=1 Tax=Serratia silvae TaxID=2824122 RepID=UPI00200CC089|nr:hypothetical protein [Serratia silvae]
MLLIRQAVAHCQPFPILAEIVHFIAAIRKGKSGLALIGAGLIVPGVVVSELRIRLKLKSAALT